MFLPIPINKGTRPDWNTRLGYPQLFNTFCGDSGAIYSMPWLNAIALLKDARAIHYTTFEGGSIIVVSKTVVYRLFFSGVYEPIHTISYSGDSVQIDENVRKQITIVDGLKAYVIDQPNGLNNFIILSELGNGFTFKTPIAVCCLNNIMIVLDKATNGWAISNANNALVWDPLQTIPKIGNTLTQGVGLETIANNLFIFGTTGIERWEPSNSTNPFSFPFVKDDNFRKDIGALSTNCIIRGLDRIYFWSSKYLPMVLTLQDLKPIADVGTAKIMSQYPHPELVSCSFYTFRGNFFAHYTWPDPGISWVYCENSETMALSNDLVVCALPDNETVATADGVFKLGFFPTASTTPRKRRAWISERLTDYKGIEPYRGLLAKFEARIVQGLQQQNKIDGLLQPLEQQQMELTISIDSESWLTTVPRVIGPPGARNDITTWSMNIAAYEWTFKLEYYGSMDFVIEKATATIY